MQNDLNMLTNWLNINRLKLNVKKTKVLLFNREALFPNVELFINGEPLDVVTQVKFLGVIVNNSLSFHPDYTVLHNRLQ